MPTAEGSAIIQIVCPYRDNIEVFIHSSEFLRLCPSGPHNLLSLKNLKTPD